MADEVVIIDDAAIAVFLNSPAGPVAEHLAKIGRQVTAVARNLAPISPRGSHGRAPGYLKTQIGWELGHDSVLGPYVVVSSPAVTADRRHAPYGKFQEMDDLRGAGGHRIKTTPHLRPALEAVFGSL